MTNTADPEIPYSYFAQHDDKHGGWLAVYTYPRNGVQHIAYVRDDAGRQRKYGEDWKEWAERDAAAALVDALNAEQRPVEGREIELPAGKRARLRFEANRIFSTPASMGLGAELTASAERRPCHWRNRGGR